MARTVDTVEHLFIVGAGFSSNAGLPLTSGFTEQLLNTKGYSPTGPSALIVKFLRKFVAETFLHSETATAEFWPELEDIFTCVDLSANTGHHLGKNYPPSELRTVRRALIVRTIRMLRQAYAKGRKVESLEWKGLQTFFSMVRKERCAFLSMNWDTVIEEGLSRTQHINEFDYGCEAIGAYFNRSIITLKAEPSKKSIQILKPHGSTNWLYCDACRHLLWFPPGKTLKIADQLFKERDWEVVSQSIGKKYDHRSTMGSCPICKSSALGTRFATFSYRKALDFPMHARSWLTAERLLRDAKSWIFIGYSLPPADYEFKYLLKRVELSRPQPPDILLITREGGATDTKQNYQKFFGPRLKSASKAYFGDGINDLALERLVKIEALRNLPT